MHEREPSIDFFSQSAALIENVCELQRSFADEFFDRLRHSDDQKNTTVDATTECCRNLFSGIANNPGKIAERQIEFWQQQLQLCSNFLRQLLGEAVEPVAQPQPLDRRFDDPEWTSNALFDYIKQSYLLTAENALQTIAELDGVESRDRERLNYFMRQLINALAPTNFALTNPDVLRTTLATQGKNLVEGMRMMVEDKKRSADILNVCVSKPDAFKVGVNIAITPGAVVAENELMQLIQYAPTTPQVLTLPILIVPSWVNKYYVLDLTEKNSFIRWLVAQGYTVFAISWVNPDASHRATQFSDYMHKGPIFAATEIERITGAPQVAGIGYCLGGILLACTLAYGERVAKQRFAAATYLATSVDFTDPGDIGIFFDEHTVDSIERQMQRRGYLDGRLLAAGFSSLRENDLYWNYYVTNYLKGERPGAFDLLHWNSDSTNVPEATHRFVMREVQQQNGLIKEGALTVDGCAINLRDIMTPTYVLATDKDHIARWHSCYAVTQLQRGPVRFALTGAGHIAGVINPPNANKYYYYVNDKIAAHAYEAHSSTSEQSKAAARGVERVSADAWLQEAQRVDGSWWLDWGRWQRSLSGAQTAARQIDSARIIEPAPGRYVRQRLDSASSQERDAA
jgi:polyhydroxyalkanoate synthase subunit PhaC